MLLAIRSRHLGWHPPGAGNATAPLEAAAAKYLGRSRDAHFSSLPGQLLTMRKVLIDFRTRQSAVDRPKLDSIAVAHSE